MVAMDEGLEELGRHIVEALDAEITRHDFCHGELTIETRPANLLKVLKYLRDTATCQFRQLIDICGVDYPGRLKRFDVIYHLLSLRQNVRIRIRVKTDETTPIPTAEGLFSTANWFEREVWDMYGVLFSDHSDLRRILTDYGFEGHPLRKDFPLTGYVEVRYSEEEKKVVYEPVALTQEFRDFDFMSPWEGARYILPGDDKADAPEDGKA